MSNGVGDCPQRRSLTVASGWNAVRTIPHRQLNTHRDNIIFVLSIFFLWEVRKNTEHGFS